MKKLMPIIAFVACLAIGGGAGAIAFKPATAPSAAVDSTHAPTSAFGSGTSPAPSHDPSPTTEPNLPDWDPAVGSDDPHVADPPRAGSGSAGTNPAGSPAGSGPGVGQVTPASTTPRPVGSPTTIESLVNSGSGATVTMRADGSIGPDRGTIEAIPDYGRMARLLARMSARDAARTVEQLPADEAARALAQMNDKAAALVLGQLAPERAASLLQAVLALVPRPAVP